MLDSKVFSNVSKKSSFLDLIAKGLVLISVGLGLLAYLFAPVNAWRWMQTPFIGAFVEQTMHFNELGPTADDTPWAARTQGVGLDDQLLQINGQPVTNAVQMQRLLSQYQPGEQVLLGIGSNDGRLRTIPVVLQTFPVADRMVYFFIPYLIGLLYLGAGVWIFVLRQYTVAGRAFSLFAVSTAIFLGMFFDTATTHTFTVLWTVAIGAMGAGIITLGLYFPVRLPVTARFPWLRWVPYAVAAGLSLYALPKLFDLAHSLAYVAAWRVLFVFSSLGAIFFLAVMVVQRYKAESPMAREQARLAIWGAVVSFGPLVVWVLGGFFFAWPFSPYLLLSTAIFPLLMAYNLLRYRFFSIDVVLSRSALYATLTVLAVAGYALVVSGLSLVAGRQLGATNPYVVGMLVFLLAVLLQPMRFWLQERIDRFFFRGSEALRSRADEFTRQLTQMMESKEILTWLRTMLNETFSPMYLHISCTIPWPACTCPLPMNLEGRQPTCAFLPIVGW